MASNLIKDKSRIRHDTDMLLIVEKGIRGGICHAIHQYANADKNT